MTKKHFIALANALQFAKPCKIAEPQGFKARQRQWIRDCKAIASACATANSNFDRERFLSACGLTSEDN